MFNSNLFNIGILLLPITLRKEKVIAWVKVYLTLVKDTMAVFTSYRTEQLFLIAHNSQTIYLEHIINSKFNPNGNIQDPDYEGNGIYITSGQLEGEVYLFNTAENGDDTYIHNTSEDETETYLFNNENYAGWQGFVVNVPDTFNVNENEMRALINRLKLAGKEFTIKYYAI